MFNLPIKMIRIALIGPESTGKSTLCEQLATHYHTKWVEEFSRKYIGNLNRNYIEEDVLFCIKEQLLLEKKTIENSAKIIFTDNEVINGKVWMMDKYSHCPEWIDDEIKNNPYDLYLLTYPDLPFIADEVRENGKRRMYFYDWYKRILDENNFNYAIIKGTGPQRLAAAIKVIEENFFLT